MNMKTRGDEMRYDDDVCRLLSVAPHWTSAHCADNHLVRWFTLEMLQKLPDF